MSGLDRVDLRTAAVALEYYRRAHLLSKRPIPPAADRLAEHLRDLVSVNGQDASTAEQHWFTTRQAAQCLQCSERTARRIARRIGRKVGRQWLIPADALPEGAR